MLLYDLSHTSHSQARTGVQRVTLELRKALREITPLAEVTHDPYRSCWRKLDRWEIDSLSTSAKKAKRRGAYWPLRAKAGGFLKRAFRNGSTLDRELANSAEGFLTAEVFTARTGRHLPALFKTLNCPTVAVFHDAIALQMPDLAPKNSVGRFPLYLAELRRFDGIIAVSEASRSSLEEYWRWAEWDNLPPIKVVSHGLDHLPKSSDPPSPNSDRPIILSVGSIEGRKNHNTLLEAAERLWRDGKEFELRIIGSLQRQTGARAAELISQLQSAGRPIRYDGWMSDDDLKLAYAECDFTVYPSLLEGFGLPVWESLLHGRPCVCSASGATGETAAGGGCLGINTASLDEMAAALTLLLEDKEKRAALAQEAIKRVPPTWHQAAQSIQGWMRDLPIGSSK